MSSLGETCCVVPAESYGGELFILLTLVRVNAFAYAGIRMLASRSFILQKAIDLCFSVND